MLLLATMAFGQAKEDAGDGKMLDKQTMEFKDYLPEIHGTIRGKYEYQTETSESRFEVRNARFSVSGNVHPIVAYKAEIDLSDEGSIKMLDAYARVFPVKDLNFTIGQMRVPFTIDAHRSPTNSISLTVHLLPSRWVMCVMSDLLLPIHIKEISRLFWKVDCSTVPV